MMNDKTWQTRQDVETMHSAMKIKKDPKRMKAAKAMMDEMQSAMMMGMDEKAKKLVKKGK